MCVAEARDYRLVAMLAVALEVVDELQAADATDIAGPTGRHDPNRTAPHGTDRAEAPMGGRLINVAKPRVRATDGVGEIGLQTRAALADRDPLGEHALVKAGILDQPDRPGPAPELSGDVRSPVGFIHGSGT